MAVMAKPLSDSDIANLAAWYAAMTEDLCMHGYCKAELLAGNDY